jgi:hypothetical protein
MAHLTRYRLAVTCTASGATVLQYVEGGLLHSWAYTPGTASAFASGSTTLIDFISDIRSGAVGVATHHGITFTGSSAATHNMPRIKPLTLAGATAADMTNGLPIPLAQEHIRLVVASGGANGIGFFDFYVEGR